MMNAIFIRITIQEPTYLQQPPSWFSLSSLHILSAATPKMHFQTEQCKNTPQAELIGCSRDGSLTKPDFHARSISDAATKLRLFPMPIPSLSWKKKLSNFSLSL